MIKVEKCLAYEGLKQTFWCPFLTISGDGALCHFYPKDGESREVCSSEETPGEKPDWCKVVEIVVREKEE